MLVPNGGRSFSPWNLRKKTSKQKKTKIFLNWWCSIQKWERCGRVPTKSTNHLAQKNPSNFCCVLVLRIFFPLLTTSGIAGPSPTGSRVFEMKERLFEKKTPELKFWHDAAGWCPHCMVTWCFWNRVEFVDRHFFFSRPFGTAGWVVTPKNGGFLREYGPQNGRKNGRKIQVKDL